MTGADLYGALGVNPEATPDDIKSAFKRRAKATHPDAGGSAEAFAIVKLAHTILSDAEKRAKYDATGEVEEDRPQATIDQEAMGLIGSMLGIFATQDDDPFSKDLLGLMRRQVNERKQQANKAIAQLERAETRVKRLAARFTRKGDGENRLAAMLEWQARTTGDGIRQSRHVIAVCERAVEILADYEFQRDPSSPPTYQSPFAQTYSTLGMFR